jgi:hypothetical protein
VGILDKLLAHDDEPKPDRSLRPGANAARSHDEQAIARYRYMLKSVPRETVEQAHAEAFARLTPEQRHMVLQEWSAYAPEGERSAVAGQYDPRALARLATRAEVRQPGTMECTLGGIAGRRMGMGGMMAGSLL